MIFFFLLYLELRDAFGMKIGIGFDWELTWFEFNGSFQMI